MSNNNKYEEKFTTIETTAGDFGGGFDSFLERTAQLPAAREVGAVLFRLHPRSGVHKPRIPNSLAVR